MNAIELKNLTFSYSKDRPILKDINLTVECGSFVSLIGSNGSGKTTLAKLLVGLLEKNEGDIYIEGIQLKKENLRAIRKEIAIVFQNPDNQFIGATVEDDIAFGMENREVSREEMMKTVPYFASLVDMEEFLSREPSTLSGGQKQRVAIAGILALKPNIIVFDESTAMLDPKGKKEIHDVITKMHKTMPELTIISITHDMEEAMLSDRIIYLKNGAIAFDDTPEKLFTNEKFVAENKIKLPFIYELKAKIKKEGLNSSGKSIEEVIKNAYSN